MRTQIGPALQAVVTRHDFEVNVRKVRLQARGDRQVVTGLIVNNKVNVRRDFVRNIRAILHGLEVNGATIAAAKLHATLGNDRRGATPSLFAHVRGKLDYLRMVRGADDYIYARYALQLANLVPDSPPVTLTGAPARTHQFLRHVVWVVLGLDRCGTHVAQGTAFALSGVGLVTAAHNFDESADRWVVVPAIQPFKQYVIRGRQAASHFDVAILDTAAPLRAVLKASDDSPEDGSNVTLVGFPGWGTAAETVNVSRAKVVQSKVASMVNYILTNGNIRPGSSGGALLNESGLVIGVLHKDGSAHVAPNSAVSIAHVAQARREALVLLR
jgi:S1-C subfamily serine protease